MNEEWAMDDEMIERISKAILNTPNASDYKTLVATNVINISTAYIAMIDAITND